MSGIPEQTLVTYTLDTGVPLSSEALCGQLELQGKGLHILTVQAGSLQLFTKSGQDLHKSGECLLLHSISNNDKQVNKYTIFISFAVLSLGDHQI